MVQALSPNPANVLQGSYVDLTPSGFSVAGSTLFLRSDKGTMSRNGNDARLSITSETGAVNIQAIRNFWVFPWGAGPSFDFDEPNSLTGLIHTKGGGQKAIGPELTSNGDEYTFKIPSNTTDIDCGIWCVVNGYGYHATRELRLSGGLIKEGDDSFNFTTRGTYSVGDVIRVVRNSSNQMVVYKNGVLVFTHTYGYTGRWVTVFQGNVACDFELPFFSGSGITDENINQPVEIASAVANIIEPLTVDFARSSTSIYLGTNLTCVASIAGGYGTQQIRWKVDGVTITSQNDLTTAVFSGLSLGSHNITCEVTDSSGTVSTTKTVFVSQITGGTLFTTNGNSSSAFATNVPATVVWSKTGSGSINSSTGVFTAPSSGQGYYDLRAEKSDDATLFSTLRRYYGAALVSDFNKNALYLQNVNFTINANSSGGYGSLTYQWLLNGVEVSTASSVTLNKPTGTYSLKLITTDSLGQTAEVTKTIETVANLPFPESRWSKLNLVPLKDSLFWNALDVAEDATEIGDFSGNDNKLAVASSAPVLQTDVINGKPGVYFDGTNNPLKFTTDLTLKHLFLVAKFDGATFTGNEGLLSGVAATSILRGNGNTTTKFANLAIGSGFVYRKDFVTLTESTQNAPMNSFAVIELVFPAGIELDGIQIGQDTSNTGRKWKGWFVEQIGYGEVQDDCATKAIYEYFALKFWLWRYKSDNYPYFPFVFNRSSKHRSTELAEISEAEGLRGSDRVVRYLDDAPLHSYDLEFNYRFYLEYLATVQFLNERRLHLPFWIEDIERTFERRMTRTTELTDNGYGSAYKFDYNFGVKDY